MRSPSSPPGAPDPAVSAATQSRADVAAPVDQAALLSALRELLQPLAELAVGQGVLFATVEEMMKTAFVAAARQAHSLSASDRVVSRISTVTGLNRREVTRLTQIDTTTIQPKASPATRVFTRWLSDPALKGPTGEPRALPRQGGAPSFESLANSVTRDVHPRSLLDELCRLGLARLDGETVHVASSTFVPKGDSARLLGFMGSNVGDHLRAAIANVTAEKPRHFEQAIFADELSQDSLDSVRELVRAQWQTLLAGTVPTLQKLIDADQATGRPQQQRVRIGLYSYTEAMPSAATPAPAPAKRAARRAPPPPKEE
jgi:Family of unknown function (DUF6502)